MSTFTLDKLRDAMAKIEAMPPAIQIVEDRNMVEAHEDWSMVRSPGRAARRRRQGHPQRIRTVYKPMKKAFLLPNGMTVMHPEMARALRAATEQRGR